MENSNFIFANIIEVFEATKSSTCNKMLANHWVLLNVYTVCADYEYKDYLTKYVLGWDKNNGKVPKK